MATLDEEEPESPGLRKNLKTKKMTEEQRFDQIRLNKLKELKDEQILAEEKAILARDVKKNLYSRMSLNERDLISLDYETWIKHM